MSLHLSRRRFTDPSHQSTDPSLFLNLKGVDDPQKMNRPCNWVGEVIQVMWKRLERLERLEGGIKAYPPGQTAHSS